MNIPQFNPITRAIRSTGHGSVLTRRIALGMAALGLLTLGAASQASAQVITLTGGDTGEGFAPRSAVHAAVSFNQTGVGPVQGVTFDTNASAVAMAGQDAGTFGGGADFTETTPDDTNLGKVFFKGFYTSGTMTATVSGLIAGREYQVDSFIGALGAGDFPDSNGRYETVQVFAADGITLLAGPDAFSITPPHVNGNLSPAFDLRQTFTPTSDTVRIRYSSPTYALVSGIAVTYTPASTDCNLLSFNWGPYSGVISGTNITLTLPVDTDLATLNPTCTLPPGAAVAPASGSIPAPGFATANPRNYTVTAADGITQKVYAVTIAFTPIHVLTGGDAGEGFAPRAALHAAVCFNQSGAGPVQGVTFDTNASAVVMAGNLPTTGGGADFTETTPADTNLGKVFSAGYYPNVSMTATITGLTAGRQYQVDSFIGAMGAVDYPDSTGRNETVQVFAADGITPLAGPDSFFLTPPHAGNTNGGLSPAFDLRQVFTPTGDTVRIHYGSPHAALLSGIAVTYTPAITDCDLLALDWGATSGVISGTNVTLSLPTGTDLATLNPTCTITPGASVSPASGTIPVPSFATTNPRNYTVTAADGVTQKVYSVTAFTPVHVLAGGDAGEGFAPRSAVHAAVSFNQSGVGPVQGVTFDTNASTVTLTGQDAGTGGGGADFTETTTNDTNLGQVFAAGYYTSGTMTATVTGLTEGREYQVDSFIGALGAADWPDSNGRYETVQVFAADGITPLAGPASFFLTPSHAGNTNGDLSPAFDIRQTFTATSDTVRIHYSSPTYPLVSGIAVTYTPGSTVGHYATWAAANGGSADPTADSNHNGVPDGVEFFMGGTAASPATLPPLVDNAGTWTWTIPYDPIAVASYLFQSSDDLTLWSDAAPGDIQVLATPDRIQFTLPSGAAKKFCRLLVTPTP